MWETLIAGFVINLFTSIDDALTRIPVLSAAARTTTGRLAFSLGNLLAVTAAVLIALALSQFLTELPGGNRTIAVGVVILAVVIYFDLLSFSPPKRVQADIAQSRISPARTRKLISLGFVMTFITMVDDMFALAPLFLHGWTTTLAALVGIYLSSLLLVVAVLFFSEKLSMFPYKRQFAFVTLLIFAALLFFGIL